jgi:hypothetical protein
VSRRRSPRDLGAITRDDGELLAGWHPESIERIAARAASNAADKTLPWGERYDHALGGIIDYLCDWESGDPPPAADLFAAANRVIARESHIYRRDHAYISMAGEEQRQFGSTGVTDAHNLAPGRFTAYWVSDTRHREELAERVVERVAVWQVIHGLKPEFAEALRTLADVAATGGTYHEAAARLGIGDSLMEYRLTVARRECRQLWLADDETARPKYGRDRGPNNHVSVTARHIYARRAAKRQAA